MGSPASPGYNVLLIHTDQQRYDTLGCSGNPYAVTPHVDALAAEGCRYSRHIAANPVCMPSRASLLTGRYPSGHGVWANGVALPRHEPVPGTPRDDSPAISHVPTLPDVLAAAGYRTGAVGKLHLQPSLADAKLGFTESNAVLAKSDLRSWHGPYYGFEHVELSKVHGENVHASHYRDWLAAHFPEVLHAVAAKTGRKTAPFPEMPILHRGVMPVEAHHSTWVAERSCEFIRANRESPRPFFLFAGFPDPHAPWTPPAALAAEFEKREVARENYAPSELSGKPLAMQRLMQSSREWSLSSGTLKPEALRLIQQYYAAMVHLLDRSVGAILRTLRESNLDQKTIVIFTSDHGDWMGDHGLVTKADVSSHSLLHVPLIMRDPAGRLPRLDERVTSNVDILPTLCAMLGVPVPADTHGVSLLSELPGDRTVQVQVFGTQPDERNFSIYDRRFRFNWYPHTDERELYDHNIDLHELHNRAGDPALAADENRLYRTLLEDLARTHSPVGGRFAPY